MTIIDFSLSCLFLDASLGCNTSVLDQSSWLWEREMEGDICIIVAFVRSEVGHEMLL